MCDNQNFAFWCKMLGMDFTKVTRQIIPSSLTPTVEECSLVVGEVVGCSIKSAAQMNRTVVIFVDSVEKAKKGHCCE